MGIVIKGDSKNEVLKGINLEINPGQGNRKNTFINQLVMYVIFGSLFGLAAFSIGDLALGLTIFFSIILVSLTMTLISEFTSVLFDPRDNLILLPRPVKQVDIFFPAGMACRNCENLLLY